MVNDGFPFRYEPRDPARYARLKQYAPTPLIRLTDDERETLAYWMNRFHILIGIAEPHEGEVEGAEDDRRAYPDCVNIREVRSDHITRFIHEGSRYHIGKISAFLYEYDVEQISCGLFGGGYNENTMQCFDDSELENRKAIDDSFEEHRTTTIAFL